MNSGYTRSTAFVVRVATPLPKNSDTKSPPSARPDSAHAEMSPASASALHPAALSPGLAVFSSWCPKAIASIGRLPDTLADRRVLIRMQRKTLQEQCERLRHPPAADLRRQCARFVLDYSQAIADACPDIPPDLNDRAADIWEPLFALADFPGDPWPMFARQAALGLTNNSQESSPAGSLFLDILIIFATKGVDRLFTRTIVEGLNQFQSHAWAEARNGKPITDICLSQQLRPYGIRPKSMRIEGVISRGYLIEDLKECFKRYIQPAEFEALTRELAAPEPPSAESATTPEAEIT